VAFRGLLPALRRSRSGLLLGARGPADGELFAVSLPARPDTVPGRGTLVVRGVAVRVQVAIPR
jgi:hypothetical protein